MVVSFRVGAMTADDLGGTGRIKEMMETAERIRLEAGTYCLDSSLDHPFRSSCRLLLLNKGAWV